ncbi:hypothetical protein NP493_1398g00049 [Ridgeia piscesae]|uniref:Coactosin-like protein n=1 Tax=Ridgeia piscesae TaxID=27915 RepID=A0AAD9NE10_RIDPI|nr:hypothetical protein NP493_1398g00049 [Ridgeia piscesae]
MSTTAEVADGDRLQEAIRALRSDNRPPECRAWLIVGHVDNNPTLIDVVAQDTSPDASIGDDFFAHLHDDQMMYCLVRLCTSFDMATTVKFVYIHWIGDNVPFVKKGRYGVVHGSIEQHFNPYHALIETGSLEDLKEDELVKKLEEGSGTRNHVIEGSLEGRQERGFTAHAVKKQVTTQLRNVAPSGASVEVTQELTDALMEVRQDTSDVSWMLAGFEDNNLKRPLALVAKGTGDISELRDSFLDDQVMYALYRTSDCIDDIKTVKFVYIYWIGEKTRPLMKGKVSAYSGPIQHIFSPMHVSLSFTAKSDIKEDVIRDKVRY